MKYIVSCFILAAILIPLAFCGKESTGPVRDPIKVGMKLPGGFIVVERVITKSLIECVEMAKAKQKDARYKVINETKTDNMYLAQISINNSQEMHSCNELGQTEEIFTFTHASKK